MKKKILVTGGNGFIGSHIVDLLLKKKYKVIVISKVTPNRFPNSKFDVSHYNIDLGSFREVENVLRIERPDTICHHATSVSYVRESFLHPQKTLCDVLYSINLFEVAKKYDVKHVLFSSSSNLYDNNSNHSYSENSKKNPLSPLGISKLMIEQYINYLQKTTGITFTIFRYFNSFGPRQRLGEMSGIIPNSIERALKDEEITIFGDGSQTRDFIYVGDIATANLKAIEKPINGTFNVGSGRGTSINELLNTIEELLKKKISKKYMKSVEKITNSVADISKIKKTFNWTPKVNLTQGLKKTIGYYKESSLYGKNSDH